eukprot:366030-Chlamydomonas_euryale.AAC.9
MGWIWADGRRTAINNALPSCPPRSACIATAETSAPPMSLQPHDKTCLLMTMCYRCNRAEPPSEKCRPVCACPMVAQTQPG